LIHFYKRENITLKGMHLFYFFASFCLQHTLVLSETVVLLGGEISNTLHPSISSVETLGACGLFDAGLPDLDSPRRDFSAALLGQDIIVCGGYKLLGSQKDCVSLELGTWPLAWETFPSMIHKRYNFGLVVVGGFLYAVGGSQSIGSEHSIERFNGVDWEEFSETQGFRTDFCSMPWGEDGLLLVGGYDDIGMQRQVNLLNVTSGHWSRLEYLNTGRGFHGCSEYLGGIMVAGGWTDNNDPQWPGQEVTRTSEWYNPETNDWTDLSMLAARRTKFAMETINGTLFSIGGWEGTYQRSLETYDEDKQGWQIFGDSISEAKAAFGVVKVPDELLEDTSCL